MLEPTGVPNIYIVFFAPSSSSYALPHLKKVFRLPFLNFHPSGSGPEPELSSDSQLPETDERPRVIPIAIGPTTATYLREVVDLNLEIVCKKPEAGALVNAIEIYRLHR